MILAGGRIKGRYYGDIRVAGDLDNGHTWSYHRPDANGVPITSGTTGNLNRVSGASVWKTVAKAMGVTDSIINSFSDVSNHPYLNYMLRG